MELLSCVIVFCDKDYTHIENLIDQINNKVHFKHEIVLVDNRDTYKNVEINIKNANLIKNNENIGPFEARRKASNQVLGDYIWFIDGDDDILDVPNNIGFYNEDVISFNFLEELPINIGVGYRKDKPSLKFNMDLYEYNDVMSYCECMLWCKFIKTDIVKEAFSKVPEKLQIVNSEDTIISILCLSSIKTLRKIDNAFYMYHSINSPTVNTSCSNQMIDRLINNIEYNQILFERYLTDKEKRVLSPSGSFEGTWSWWLKKIIDCDYNTLIYALNKIVARLNNKTLISMLESYLDCSMNTYQILFALTFIYNKSICSLEYFNFLKDYDWYIIKNSKIPTVAYEEYKKGILPINDLKPNITIYIEISSTDINNILETISYINKFNINAILYTSNKDIYDLYTSSNISIILVSDTYKKYIDLVKLSSTDYVWFINDTYKLILEGILKICLIYDIYYILSVKSIDNSRFNRCCKDFYLNNARYFNNSYNINNFIIKKDILRNIPFNVLMIKDIDTSILVYNILKINDIKLCSTHIYALLYSNNSNDTYSPRLSLYIDYLREYVKLGIKTKEEFNETFIYRLLIKIRDIEEQTTRINVLYHIHDIISNVELLDNNYQFLNLEEKELLCNKYNKDILIIIIVTDENIKYFNKINWQYSKYTIVVVNQSNSFLKSSVYTVINDICYISQSIQEYKYLWFVDISQLIDSSILDIDLSSFVNKNKDFMIFNNKFTDIASFLSIPLYNIIIKSNILSERFNNKLNFNRLQLNAYISSNKSFTIIPADTFVGINKDISLYNDVVNELYDNLSCDELKCLNVKYAICNTNTILYKKKLNNNYIIYSESVDSIS